MPEKSLVAKFQCIDGRLIRCCHAMDQYLYIGSGPEGIVYRTQDGFALSEFYKVEDTYVTAIADYGNALFVGTSPGGNIFMHNFNTGNRFHYVISGDYSISAFCIFQEKLYAGTSPSGLVLSFDGNQWNMEYDCYGSGIKSMSVVDGKMLVFVENAESIPYLSGSAWSFLKSGDEYFSITSARKVKTTIPTLSNNPNSDFSFNCSCVLGSKVYFCPENKCNLYCYDGSKVSIVYQWSGGQITAIEAVGEKQLFVAVDDILYVTEVL